MAEAQDRAATAGGPSKSSENPTIIREPAKHFALMFGVSRDYAYMARCQRRRECASAGRSKNASLTMRGATVPRDAGFSGVTAN
jgi:hypothetical protein